jgi:mannose-6-phosphate isomerase-like protein (cupin superfamily)
MKNNFGQMQLFDLKDYEKKCKSEWDNFTLSQVNDCVVRLGIIKGEYHWHKHDNEDECFLVISGRLYIDFEGNSIELLQNQLYIVPRGMLHKTRAVEKTVVLMVEKDTITPTGDK